jgi:hypothetical protein
VRVLECSTASVIKPSHALGFLDPEDPVRLADGSDVASAAVAWAADRIGREPVLIYATSGSVSVKAVQAKLGTERAGELVENALAAIARGLVETRRGPTDRGRGRDVRVRR